ncbi:hypothetical protein ACEV9E_25400, partial [Vibrio parahaemolyticus]
LIKALRRDGPAGGKGRKRKAKAGDNDDDDDEDSDDGDGDEAGNGAEGARNGALAQAPSVQPSPALVA